MLHPLRAHWGSGRVLLRCTCWCHAVPVFTAFRPNRVGEGDSLCRVPCLLLCLALTAVLTMAHNSTLVFVLALTAALAEPLSVVLAAALSMLLTVALTVPRMLRSHHPPACSPPARRRRTAGWVLSPVTSIRS